MSGKGIITGSRDRDEWLEKKFRSGKERNVPFTTVSGRDIEPLYTESDIDGWSPEKDLGFPGEFPFTRGVHPTMYRGRLWTMRQYAGFGTARESNQRYKYLLEQGQTGLSVAFDLPTQLGYDSDHPLSEGEVGKVGVAVDTLDDVRTLFDGIPLDKVSISMTINSTAPVLLAMLVAVARERGLDPAVLRGTVQNDVLKEYIARGTYIFPPGPSLNLTADLIRYCAANLPRFNPISISGYHIREAGSTAVQEVAFTLQDGVTYVQAALDRGLDIDAFAPRLSFFFAAHSNLFEEVAKFRAARTLWARIVKERFGAKKQRSMLLRFHTQTGGSTLTSRGVMNNVVRVTIQALAAILGGTQSLHTNALDEALALPTEDTARLALRTQQVLAFETHVADTADPLGGSYLVEHLTARIMEKAEALMAWVEEHGGMVKAIEDGLINRRIDEAAYRQSRQVDAGTRKIVGVNVFQEPQSRSDNTLKVSEDVQRQQRAALERFKAARDQSQVTAALGRVSEAAKDGQGIMETIVDAVEAGASLGEVTAALESVYGRYRPRTRI